MTACVCASNDRLAITLEQTFNKAGGPMHVVIERPKNGPPGQLAHAELHFTEGPLSGLKLIGFTIWERRAGNGRNVTFPARQYNVNGERRTFALLRPIAEVTAQDKIRDIILQSYADYLLTEEA